MNTLIALCGLAPKQRSSVRVRTHSGSIFKRLHGQTDDGYKKAGLVKIK